MRMDIESATDLAVTYIKKAGYTWSKVVGANNISDKWIVKIDVAAYGPAQVKTITIDDNTGKVIGYE